MDGQHPDRRKTLKKLERLKPFVEKAVDWKIERALHYRFMQAREAGVSASTAAMREEEWKAYRITPEAREYCDRLREQLLKGDENALLMIVEEYEDARFNEKLPFYAKDVRGIG